MTATMQSGFAKREITPPAGELMGAFPVCRDPMQARVAEGVHDPLWARAWALRASDTTLVVCAADVVAFHWVDVDRMRAGFAERTGLPGEALVVCGTHNHNGPECTYLFGGTPDAPSMDHVREGVVAAAVEALDAPVPVTLSVGAVEADLATNRRSVLPDGRFQPRSRNPERQRVDPVDSKVTVVRLDREDGEAASAVVHFAAHPVIMSYPNRLFTAEYPGSALRHFAEQTGVMDGLFLQGACGDTHPYQALVDDFAAVEEMGEGLAAAAALAWEQAGPQTDLELAVERWHGDLPHCVSSHQTVRVEITAVRLSPRVAVVFWQGEPFVELSLALQWRSPFARTIVVGYSLGSVGYVPTRQAYEYGGYGVDRYDGDPPEFCRTTVAPGAGETLVDRTAELLRALR